LGLSPESTIILIRRVKKMQRKVKMDKEVEETQKTKKDKFENKV
jgi:hypothetical protein